MTIWLIKTKNNKKLKTDKRLKTKPKTKPKTKTLFSLILAGTNILLVWVST
jgi:hypothetical protein